MIRSKQMIANEDKSPSRTLQERDNGFYLTYLKRFYFSAGLKPWFSVLLFLVAGVMYVGQAYYLSDSLAHVLQGGGWGVVRPSLMVFAYYALLRLMCIALSDYLSWVHAQYLKQVLREQALQHVLFLGDVSRLSTGAWSSLVVDQIEKVDVYFDKYLKIKWSSVLLPLMYILVVIYQDWVAGLLLLVTAPLLIVFMALVGWGAQSLGNKYAQSLSRLSGVFLDRLQGLETLKRFKRQHEEMATIDHSAQALKETNLKVLRVAFLSSAVLEFFAALGVAGVAVYIGLTYFGFFTFRTEVLSFQVGLFCLLLAPEVYAPLRQYATLYHEQTQVIVLLKQLDDFFPGFFDKHNSKIKPLERNKRVTSSAPLQSTLWHLEQFNVLDQNREALLEEPLSLTIRQGDKVWIHGVSGIGKSSLLQALVGLRAYVGDLTFQQQIIDNDFLQQHAPEVLYLSQQPYLLSDDVLTNLRFFYPQSSSDELLGALGKAQFDSEEVDLKRRLDDAGLGLSAGQQQRLSLARLFLSTASIIILDEPTAYLDKHLATLVWQQIALFSRDKTLIVVSHDRPEGVLLTHELSLGEER